MNKIFSICTLLSICTLALSPTSAHSATKKWRLEAGIELQAFAEKGFHTDARTNASLSVTAEKSHEWNRGDDILYAEFFARIDEQDDERTHADIRELSWLHIEESSDLRIGFSRVFWGVTESQHLVDIINQTDLVENPDGEDKLGQPMIQWTWINDWGILDLHALLGFRERLFPGENGRFRTVYPIDQDKATFESSAGKQRLDAAIRFTKTLGSFDIGLSYFSGTDRAPLLLIEDQPSGKVYVPYYPQLEQAGVVSQYALGDWLWKLELVSRKSMGDRYTASTFGFEYTQVGVFSSAYDLGWLVEYSFDDRGTAGPSPFEHDWFMGWRLGFNDADSSEALMGILWDPVSNESTLSLEASTRLNQDMTIALELKFFNSDDNVAHASLSDKKLAYLAKDSYASLVFNYYF